MNLNPIAVALALEITRRLEAMPEGETLADVMQSMIEDHPDMDLNYVAKLTAQINDMVELSSPPSDRIRVALIVSMPDLQGAAFVAQDMLVSSARLSIVNPIREISHILGKQLGETWPRFRKDLERIPIPKVDPSALLDPDTNCIGRHHPAAAGGPLPSNIQNFIKP